MIEPDGNAASTPTADLPAEPDQLARGLSNRHLQLMALGGAIGTGMFMGSSKTINVAGPSSMLVYAVIGFFMYFMMRAMGEMLLANLKYKSFRDIAEHLLGPAGGFIAGWTYWFGWIVAAMGDLAAITGYARYWWPEIPKWVPAAALVITVFVLNVVAVRYFGEAEFWFALIKLVAVVALLVVAAVLLFGHHKSDQGTSQVSNLWNNGGFFPNGIVGFLAGFQIAFFAFIGIEVVGTAAAETKDPHRNLPMAIRAIPIRLALFYVLAMAAICMVIPWDKVVPGVSPFVTVFEMAGLGIAASLVNFVLLTAAASSDNSGLYSTSRMMYGLALDGQAPRSFGRLSKRHVPQNALIVSCIMVFGGVIFLYTNDTIIQAFEVVTTIASVLFLVVWTLIAICYIVYRRKYPQLHAASKFKSPGGIVMAWVVVIFFAASLFVLFGDESTRKGILMTPIWFIFIGGCYWFQRKKFRAMSKISAQRYDPENS